MNYTYNTLEEAKAMLGPNEIVTNWGPRRRWRNLGIYRAHSKPKNENPLICSGRNTQI